VQKWHEIRDILETLDGRLMRVVNRLASARRQIQREH
jgi:hypothetical protein